MLDRHAHGAALERWDPAEPLVDSHSQRILIAGWRWQTVELLRCHRGGRAGGTLRVMDGQAVETVILNRCGEAKVTHHQDKSFAKQHVLRLDITVDDHSHETSRWHERADDALLVRWLAVHEGDGEYGSQQLSARRLDGLSPR